MPSTGFIHIKSQRTLSLPVYVVVFITALAWALFQLSLPRFTILDSITKRAIHLSFGLIITFLVTPMFKKRENRLPFLHSRSGLPTADILLVLAALTAIGYIIFAWEGISNRSGVPTQADMIFSVIFVLILLEAARRAIGSAMVILICVLSAYIFFGYLLPDLLAFRGVSLTRYMNQVVLSTEGIFGIPLDVATSMVYLFVLFGTMLEHFGAGTFFNDTSIALLGRFTGGPAKASVISSGLSGLVSGSSIANVVTTGTFTIPLMKKVGYPPHVAAATEVAASTNGQLMPPIMGAAAFIIAEYLGIGYIGVIKAAIIPAAISYVALFYITHLEALRYNLRKLEPREIPSMKASFLKGGHHIIPLAVLIIDLAVLRRTPQFAVFRGIVTLVIVVLLRMIIIGLRKKENLLDILKKFFKTLTASLVNGSINMLPVTLATAAAGIIVGIINMGLGSLIIQIVERLAFGNFFILLLLTAIFSIIIGMGLPTTATYVVMASITVPIITKMGGAMGIVVPAIAAHLFCFYFGIIADDTPPVGLAAYTAAAIAKTSPLPTGITGFIYDLRTAIIPFIFIFNPLFILEGITSFWTAIGIFLLGIMGSLSFTNFIQGRMKDKNRWYESIIFLLISATFFLGHLLAQRWGLSFASESGLYAGGLLLYLALYGLQRLRMKSAVVST